MLRRESTQSTSQTYRSYKNKNQIARSNDEGTVEVRQWPGLFRWQRILGDGGREMGDDEAEVGEWMIEDELTLVGDLDIDPDGSAHFKIWADHSAQVLLKEDILNMIYCCLHHSIHTSYPVT